MNIQIYARLVRVRVRANVSIPMHNNAIVYITIANNRRNSVCPKLVVVVHLVFRLIYAILYQFDLVVVAVPHAHSNMQTPPPTEQMNKIRILRETETDKCDQV